MSRVCRVTTRNLIHIHFIFTLKWRSNVRTYTCMHFFLFFISFFLFFIHFTGQRSKKIWNLSQNNLVPILPLPCFFFFGTSFGKRGHQQFIVECFFARTRRFVFLYYLVNCGYKLFACCRIDLLNLLNKN